MSPIWLRPPSLVNLDGLYLLDPRPSRRLLRSRGAAVGFPFFSLLSITYIHNRALERGARGLPPVIRAYD